MLNLEIMKFWLLARSQEFTMGRGLFHWCKTTLKRFLLETGTVSWPKLGVVQKQEKKVFIHPAWDQFL